MQIRCNYDELIPIAELKKKFHPKNRNKHPRDQIVRLAKLMKYQGIRKVAVLSTRSGFLTAGHGRILAAEEAGEKEYPVEKQDYENEDQEIADLNADNAIGLWAEMDLSGINADVPDLGPDFDIDFLGIKNFVVDVSEKTEVKEHERALPGSAPDDPNQEPKKNECPRCGYHF